jgi:hypothetical protein
VTSAFSDAAGLALTEFQVRVGQLAFSCPQLRAFSSPVAQPWSHQNVTFSQGCRGGLPCRRRESTLS